MQVELLDWLDVQVTDAHTLVGSVAITFTVYFMSWGLCGGSFAFSSLSTHAQEADLYSFFSSGVSRSARSSRGSKLKIWCSRGFCCRCIWNPSARKRRSAFNCTVPTRVSTIRVSPWRSLILMGATAPSCCNAGTQI